MRLTESQLRQILGVDKLFTNDGKALPQEIPWATKKFLATCRGAGILEPQPEFRFHHERKWRFDFAWVEAKVYLEVQGGIWQNGRHSRGAALLKEWEKLNTATAMGWRPLFCQPNDLCKPITIRSIKEALAYSEK